VVLGLAKSDSDPFFSSIVTFHSSKGLEFPVVAIPGIGYLPREQEDVNEEVRLMYVGMTRAMEHLVMTCHKNSEFTVKLRSAQQEMG
jgi:superfamily I DNA/RNA helicase